MRNINIKSYLYTCSPCLCSTFTQIFIKIRIGLSEFSCKIVCENFCPSLQFQEHLKKRGLKRSWRKSFTESSFTLQYIEKFSSHQTAKSIFAVLNFSLENLIGSSREQHFQIVQSIVNNSLIDSIGSNPNDERKTQYKFSFRMAKAHENMKQLKTNISEN